MSRPSNTNIAFFALTSLTILASASMFALSWPLMLKVARAQSESLVQKGINQPREALADFTLATKLNSSNQTAQYYLATSLLDSGQSTAALDHLKLAGNALPAQQLHIRTLIEQNRSIEASAVLTPQLKATNPVLAGLVFMLNHQQTNLADLMASTTAPEALQSLARMQAGPLPLATELYAAGLLDASRRIAISESDSYERDLLLATISTDRGNVADLSTAMGYLSTAIKQNPSGVAAHRAMAKLYRLKGHLNDANREELLVKSLK